MTCILLEMTELLFENKGQGKVIIFLAYSRFILLQGVEGNLYRGTQN